MHAPSLRCNLLSNTTNRYQWQLDTANHAHWSSEIKGITDSASSSPRSTSAYHQWSRSLDPTQSFKGDCLNVIDNRRGDVKASLPMPWEYLYLASLVMTCTVCMRCFEVQLGGQTCTKFSTSGCSYKYALRLHSHWVRLLKKFLLGNGGWY